MHRSCTSISAKAGTKNPVESRDTHPNYATFPSDLPAKHSCSKPPQIWPQTLRQKSIGFSVVQNFAHIPFQQKLNPP